MYVLEDPVKKSKSAAEGFMRGLFRDKSEAEAFNLFWKQSNFLYKQSIYM